MRTSISIILLSAAALCASSDEVRAEVRTFTVKLFCGKCIMGDGLLIDKKDGDALVFHTGGKTIEMRLSHILASNPPQYVYKCPECENTKTSESRFPRVEYEPVCKTEVSESIITDTGRRDR